MSKGTRGRSQETKGVAESRLRSDQRKKHRDIDPAVLLTEDNVRSFLESYLCPFCGAGPFKVTATHTSRAHGVGPDELREMAGLGYTASITPPDYHEYKVREGKARGLPVEARAALEQAKMARTENGYSPRRSSPAVIKAAKMGYEAKLKRLREMQEHRDLTDTELKVLIAAQAAETHKARTRAAREAADAELLKIAVDESKTFTQIAAELGLNPHTISRRLHRLGMDVDGRARSAATNTDMGRIHAAAQEASRARREETLASWDASEMTWQSLVDLAALTGRSKKSMQAYLRKHGRQVPDGRVETTERRTNYRTKRHHCDISGCPREHVARGLCRYHYREWRIEQGLVPMCTRPGCEKPQQAHQLCSTHYAAQRSATSRK